MPLVVSHSVKPVLIHVIRTILGKDLLFVPFCGGLLRGLTGLIEPAYHPESLFR
jgi:hypothetical protein